MSLFTKKPVEDSDDEVAEMESNIGTMQDDVAKVITNKNRGGLMTKSRRNNGDRQSGRSKEMQRDLADVYTDNDGQIPDLTRLDRADRPLWQTILYSLVAVFAVLLAVSIAGFFVFSNLNKESFTNERVAFKIEPPIAIVAGQDQTYTIIISNNENVNLYNLEAILLYPDSFQYVSGTPEATGDKKNTWDISVLKIGETKEIKFTARLNADVNSVQNLSGTLTFKPENLNADFNQKASVDLGVNSSVLAMAISGPDKVMSDQSTQYVVSLSNVGVDTLKNIKVSAEFPSGFVPASSTPAADDGFNNVWTISALATSTAGNASTSAKQIIIRGKYSGVADSGNQEFKVRAELMNAGSALLAAEQSFTSNIIKDQLDLSLVVNGSAVDQAVSFGDLLFYTLTYKNTGQDPLKNIILTANLNSQVLDWNTFIDNNSGKTSGNIITWTGKEAPQLLNLQPGESGELSWQIRVKDLAGLNQAEVTKFSIENTASAQVTNKDGATDTVTGKVLTNSINSDLSLQAAARYYDENNLALGAGPIQPKSGSASSYNIKLTLANNLHNIGNIIVTANMPKNVNWDGKETHDTGDIAYSAKARKITWMISKLPKAAQGAEADFNLSITPTDNDIGRVLILLPEISLVAKDLDTGADISKTIKAITTSFNDPIVGQVSGIVE